MKVRNFGLRSRNPTRALITAYRLKGNGYGANETVKTALAHFTEHIKEQFGIKDLRYIQREHVVSYALSLNERFENGDISASTAQNYLSPVNVALENARLDNFCRVEGVRDVGLPTRTGIAKKDKSASQAQHNYAVEHAPERLRAQLELQRQLGLRFKESCLIDAREALKQVGKYNKVTIENGTKGGRERDIPITSYHQFEALKRAAEIQACDRSLVPSNQTWAQYQSQSYRNIKHIGIHFHQERHHYANTRYEEIVGCLSPVKSKIEHTKHIGHLAHELCITKTEAALFDKKARQTIAEELGHSRISITNNYLG